MNKIEYFCGAKKLFFKMLKKIVSVLFSTRMMALLFIVYAVAMAVGTFIESKYNTPTAKILIYDAWWFEAILLFFLINFFGNIKRYQLLKKEKWATLVLHLSFIFIIIGAGITRYLSFEGMMPIRESATSNEFFSDQTYLTVFVDGDYKGEPRRRVFEKKVLFSQAIDNNFSLSNEFNDIPFQINLLEFIMDAKETITPQKNGVLYLKLVESSEGSRHEHYLKEGEVQNIHNLLFALNKPTQGAINITVNEDKTVVNMPFDGAFMRMADQLKGTVAKNKDQDLMFRSLYNVGNAQFVFPDQPIRGEKTFKSSNDYKSKKGVDALVLNVASENQIKKITVVGSKGSVGDPVELKIGALDYIFYFGSKVYKLPFSIKLNDFIADKYPGTDKSYSAFKSKISVIDANKTSDAEIFMNHIYDKQGYRFFQSSFDPDEKGTILSVNHDFWGTLITYIGYFMLFFGMMAILFAKNTRFDDLKRKLDKVKSKKNTLLFTILFFATTIGFSQNHTPKIPSEKQIDSILNKYKVSEEHAQRFGRLVIQDAGGRLKPINTFSSELLRKVSHEDTYKNMNADQVFLSMSQFSSLWFEVPIIVLKRGNDSIRKIIGIKKEAKHTTFRSFFDDKGNYKLSPYLDQAYKTANPNQFEKDFIEADKKVNLLNDALSGKILRIFPIPNDKNNKWASYLEINHTTGTALDSIKNALPFYLRALTTGTETKKFTLANSMLVGLENYQKKFGAAVRPSDKKIDAEILYNKYDIFKKLPYWYLYAAILMLLFVILEIFKERKVYKKIITGLHLIIGFLFVLHTLGLAFRWYISGHAPWSNAYESIIYVAWATLFFGLAFDRKSKLTIASAAFVAAMILAAAYANWIDPEIANLQPVLNSYWLMIHVAVIVASYGPFALGFILGFVSLLLIFFTNEKNKAKMDLNIKEITYINEMALTVGLVMLTIGNFLGGQWANESWGRYWGWDPKETWALISIMVYAFVIHARFVPALRNKWIFNLMSMYAFLSILFTYYGVNFHLTGLHSYASGEPKSLNWIWYSLVIITIVGVVTYFKHQKYYKKPLLKHKS
jgi:cytochrome c-type biogenesis protein CcsB